MLHLSLSNRSIYSFSRANRLENLADYFRVQYLARMEGNNHSDVPFNVYPMTAFAPNQFKASPQ